MTEKKKYYGPEDWQTPAMKALDEARRQVDELEKLRAEVEQLRALMTPQPSDLDMAIEMLTTGMQRRHNEVDYWFCCEFYADLCDTVLIELERIRTVQNVNHNPEP